jgi:hypothetical protein
LDRVIDLARVFGRWDIVGKLPPPSHRSFNAIKRDLIRTIKENIIDEDLWRLYTDAMLFLPKNDKK